MILLIDTTSSKIRLVFGDAVSARASERQSVELPKMVGELLAGKARPTAIGVITGPGSFTGIRLGIAYAKGLAMGFCVPVVGINIFELVNAAEGEILAIDSCRGDWFVCENGNHRIEKTLPARAKIIADYDLMNGVKIAERKLKAAENGDLPPVIPLYIRPSYVG